MTATLLALDVREGQAKATRKVLVRWQRKPIPRRDEERARLARDLSGLIADHVSKQSEVRRMVSDLVQRVTDKSPDEIDHANHFLEKYLGVIVGLGEAFQGFAGKVTAAGLEVKGLDALETAIDEWKRLREDLPERFALAYKPVRSAVRKRVAKALAAPPVAADW